jgi:hypothetical protein
MRTAIAFRSSAAAIGALLLTAACDTQPLPPAEEGPAFNRSGNAVTAKDDLLKAVRQATSRFNSTQQAIRSGYVPDDHCVAHPTLGGMGYHWANPALVDPVFDPLAPEVILYAEGPGGNLRMVAVEYVVIDVGQDRPSFNGHLFDVGGTPIPVPHWSLHVWLYETNPSGMFVPFNPSIQCPA